MTRSRPFEPSTIDLIRLGMICLVSALLASSPAAAQNAEDHVEQFAGTEICSSCHRITANEWAHTVHASIFLLNPRSELEARGCEACHGPGDQHRLNPLDPATIVRFTEGSMTPVTEQNGMCLTCHNGGERIHWIGSIHEDQDLACSDCHNPMARFSEAGLLANISVNETCFGCHQTERAQFQRRSHMPLTEGNLTCTDCHNPHGTVTDPLLRTDTVNGTCLQCHAEKRGPFLFEHAPVSDSCMNCHTPHGSNHEQLLVTARPILCQQCHTSVGHMNDLLTRGNLASGSMPDPRVVGRSCQNCHTQIHGSNHPAGAKFQR
ncbi:MAG TPA: DmsE family decaheme c-type cytochrome [Gammaproteobacteria bacterium]